LTEERKRMVTCLASRLAIREVLARLRRKSLAAAARRSLLLLLAALCVACGGKQAASACMTGAADVLSLFVGSWACQDTVTSCASYQTPACATETGLDFVTFTANTDAGTLSMTSTTLTCNVMSTGSAFECVDEYCVVGGAAAVMESRDGGTPANGTFIIAGDSASFSRTERIRANVTISLSGTCARSEMLDAGPVDLVCESSSARYSIEQEEYGYESDETDTSCSADAAVCRPTDCCFIPAVGESIEGPLCVVR